MSNALNDFRLRVPTYPSASAARKAVGRFKGWTDQMRSGAHKAIDAHFGAAVAPVKRGPGRPRKVDTAASTTGSAVQVKRGPGRPRKSETSSPAPAKRGRPRKNAAVGTASAARAVKEEPVSTFSTAVQAIQLCNVAASTLETVTRTSDASIDTVQTVTSLLNVQNAALLVIAQELPLWARTQKVELAQGVLATKEGVSLNGDNGGTLHAALASALDLHVE